MSDEQTPVLDPGVTSDEKIRELRPGTRQQAPDEPLPMPLPYSNSMRTVFHKNEIMVEFCQSAGGRRVPVAGIVVSPEHLRDMIAVFIRTLEQHEANHGSRIVKV